jgi:glycerol-1-phosphatase
VSASSDGRPLGVGLIGSDVPLVQRYDLALLDLDGVVYIGADAVPGAADALASARSSGLRLVFVTNNASRPAAAVAEHLTRLGVEVGADDVMTSAQAAASLLAQRFAPGSAVLVVGGEGLRSALTAEGLVPVGSVDDGPVAVVQGFSPEVGWPMLAEGSRAVRAGLPWLATNRDPTFPTKYGPAPGNGTLVAAVATATGVEPEVAGKPQPVLFQQAARRYGSSRPLVVGDRLDTDLEGARAARMDGLLVLTGVSGAADALTAAPVCRPSYLSADLAGLQSPHPAPRPEADGWRCGQAVVRAAGGALEVTVSGPDPLDLLRAGCAAAWAAADAAAPGNGTSPPRPDSVLAALRGFAGTAGWAR